jgi:hypothetical protein
MPDIIHPDIWVISIFMKLPLDDRLQTSSNVTRKSHGEGFFLLPAVTVTIGNNGESQTDRYLADRQTTRGTC